MCYLPPISWFSAYLGSHSGNTGTPGAGDPKAHELWIESKEHFPRQSYRNRCHIHSPNGLLALSIPVQKGSGQHTALKDVRISPHHPWQKIHWRSLEAAYRSSAFFEYYEDDLVPFYDKKFDFLYDLNEQLLALILNWLKQEPCHRFTEKYYQEYPPDVLDYRDQIHPKKPPVSVLSPYYQVFSDRIGFLPDLSIIDLLFNHGNKTASMIVEESR